MASDTPKPRHGTHSHPRDDSDDRERICPESRVCVELGALRVETHGESLKEAEQTFYRVWEYVIDEMDEMTDAMRERLGGYQ